MASLGTEASDSALTGLDALPTAEIVRAVASGRDAVMAAVAAAEEDIARLADAVAERMARGRSSCPSVMAGMLVANDKLRARAARVCAQGTGCTDEAARAALRAAGDDLAVAIVALAREIPVEDVRRRLAATGGAIRAAIEAP